MLKEFREFIARGNVLDLAVGVVIGAAFTTIVNSFVKDLLSPFIGLFGTANFDNMFLVLKEGKTPGPYATPELAQAAGAVTLNYGMFLTALITFLIVAFAIFLVVKAANKIRKPEAAVVEPTAEEKVLVEIRDLLKANAKVM